MFAAVSKSRSDMSLSKSTASVHGNHRIKASSLPELSKWRRLQRGERHIPLTLQSPQGPIWLEGGKGFNLGLIQLLLKWNFLPVRTSGVQSADLQTDARKAQRSRWEAQPRIRDNPAPTPSSCRASLLHHQDYPTVWRFFLSFFKNLS